MDNAELQSLINDLDELSAWLWMGCDEKKNTALKMDAIIDRHRPNDMLGD